jgi:trigger factor
MATVTRENIGHLHDKLIVKVEKDDYLPAFEKALKSHAKSANIPGFRKGMVPSGVIKKMYGKEILGEEVIRLVEEKLTNYLNEEKLPTIGQPLPLEGKKLNFDVNQLADYELEFEIGLKPEINIDLQNIHVTRYKIEVSDETIDEEVKFLRMKNGKKVDVEAIGNKAEDVIDADFKETDEAGNEIEDGFFNTLKDMAMDTFSDTAFDLLSGKKKDDTLIIQLNKAFEGEELEGILDDLGYEIDDKETAEKFAKITINRIHQLQIAPIDETLFETVYPNQEIKTEEEFRAKQRSEFDVLFSKRSTNNLRDQMYHYLMDHIQLEFPEAFLLRLLQVGNEKQKSAEEAEKEYPKFAKQLQWYFISNKFEQDFNITVSKEEQKEYARRRIQTYWGANPNSEEDKDFMDRMTEKLLADKSFIREAHNIILDDKIFELLENHVQIKEEPIGEKDFFEMIRKHDEQHHHENEDEYEDEDDDEYDDEDEFDDEYEIVDEQQREPEPQEGKHEDEQEHHNN